MRLHLAATAQADLLAIGRYIARDDRAAARRHVERLKARARLALKNPRAGRIVPELGREDVREVILGNYRILYAITPSRLVVLRVLEGHRLLRPEELGDER